jgi:hypothetical protein
MKWLDTLLPVAHTAERTAEISAPAERVWAALTDVAAFPEWRPDVASVDQLPDETWREHGKNGVITYHVTAAEPPSRLVVRISHCHLAASGNTGSRPGKSPSSSAARSTIPCFGSCRDLSSGRPRPSRRIYGH